MNTEPARLSPLSRQELPHGRVLAEPNSAAVGTCRFIRESAAHSSFRHIDDEKAAEPHLDVGIRAILHQALSVAQFHGCSGFRRLKNRPADENASNLKACLGRPSCPIGLLLPGTGKQREAQGGFRDQEEVVHGRPLSWVRASLRSILRSTQCRASWPHFDIAREFFQRGGFRISIAVLCPTKKPARNNPRGP